MLSSTNWVPRARLKLEVFWVRSDVGLSAQDFLLSDSYISPSWGFVIDATQFPTRDHVIAKRGRLYVPGPALQAGNLPEPLAPIVSRWKRIMDAQELEDLDSLAREEVLSPPA